MNKVVIIGAGGLGRQVLAQLQVDFSHGLDWVIEGFLDERGPEVVEPALYYPWLGYPDSYVPQANQLFVVAIGDTASRERQVQHLLSSGAQFIAVRTRCQLGTRTAYGSTFFGYDVSCGVDCTIGDFGFIDQQALLGHDVITEDYVHIGPRCVIAGNVRIGKGAVVNSGAMIARGLSVGEGATVGMGAVVFQNVPAGATVVGNPARVIFHKKSEQPG